MDLTGFLNRVCQMSKICKPYVSKNVTTTCVKSRLEGLPSDSCLESVERRGGKFANYKQGS